MWQAVRDAELSTLGLVVDGGVASRWGAAEARHALYLVGEQQRYDDPADEIGVGVQRRRYRTGGLGATTAWARLLGRHRLLAAGELRADLMSDRDLRSSRVATSGHRLGLAPALALELGTGAVVVTPALRVDVGRTAAPVDLDRPLAMAPPPRWDVLPSPRLSARHRLTDALTVKGSVGGYARSPTLLELFGDRGFIVGTPELRPERGWSGDLGLALAPADRRGRFDRLYLEAAGFATRSTDTIVLTSTLGGVARPLNVGGARTAGLELSGSARLARRLLVVGNYTAMWTEQQGGEASYAGRDLPRRPRHAAAVRIDLADRLIDRLVDLWAGLDWQAGSYLDQANLQRVPGRALLSVGGKAGLTEALAVGLEVSNLLDARQAALPLDPAPRPDLATVPTAIADVAGFPLPGRAVYLSATWRR